MSLLHTIKKFLPSKLKTFGKALLKKHILPDPRLAYHFTSYSQEGEDLILRNYFDGKNTGCFVDVGAHHPVQFSNTYFFYKLGWRGINIDALPGSMKAFQKLRPEDINIEAAVSDKSENIPFYLFHEPAINTFNKDVADKFKAEGWEFKETKNITTQPLNDILAENLSSNSIDLMSIDVEGYELTILRAMDWEKYRPTMMLVEDLNFDFKTIYKNELHNFMLSKNYSLCSKTCNTLFYKSNR